MVIWTLDLKLNEVAQRLAEQLKNLGVPFTDDFEEALKNTDHVVDSIFGPLAVLFMKMSRTNVLKASASPVKSGNHSLRSSRLWRKRKCL